MNRRDRVVPPSGASRDGRVRRSPSRSPSREPSSPWACRPGDGGGGNGGRHRHGDGRLGRSGEIAPRVRVLDRRTACLRVDPFRHVLARDLLRRLRGNAPVPSFRISAFPLRGRIFHGVRSRPPHEEPVPLLRFPDPASALRGTRLGIRSRLDSEVRHRKVVPAVRRDRPLRRYGVRARARYIVTPTPARR